MDVKAELLSLSDFSYQRLRTRLDGMTDEEYLWEPAPDCWTIHRSDDGTVTGDFGLVFTEAAPVTTIAWRMCHIIDMYKEDRCAVNLGLEPEPSAAEEWLPITADEARDYLERAYDAWRRYLAATDESELGDKIGPRGKNFASSTRLGFVLHILDEVIHHGAEVGTLRDLYRAHQPQDELVLALLRADRDAVDAAGQDALDRAKAEHPDLMVRAAATARWKAVPLLADLGFPVNGSTGRSAIHHAAAAGRLDLVRELVRLGADLHTRDPQFRATPKEWALYFDRQEVADYLPTQAGQG